jgi:hypothetical protein
MPARRLSPTVPRRFPRRCETTTAFLCGEVGLTPGGRVSAETVRTHIRNAMDKLGGRTRGQAIVLALRKGEIRL